MIDIHALARTVVGQEWGLPGDVVDAMWSTFVAMPRHEGPLSQGSGLVIAQRPLAGNPARTEQVAIAVFIFVQLAQQLADNATRDQVIAKLGEIGVLLRQESVVDRITATCQEALSKVDNTITSFAARYANELLEPETLTKEAAQEYLQHPERYAIFIYHQRNLHPDMVGQVSFNGRPMHKQAQSTASAGPERSYLTAREYTILRHVLKNEKRTDMRSLPDLVEHCWRDYDRAKDLREKYNRTTTKRDVYHELSAGVRGTLSKLSNILHQSLGVHLRSNETGIYSIAPPCVFCVIEEL